MRGTVLDRISTALVLRLDGAVNVLGGLAVVAAAAPLAAPLGLDAAWPLRLLGAALVAYGAENLLVARTDGHGGTAALALVDVLFGVSALVVAVADPTGAEVVARWVVGAVGAASLTVGVVKVLLARRTGASGLGEAAA